MKKCILGFLALTFFGTSLSAQEDEIDDAQDKVKVETAVVKWADSVFYAHSNYKFENFRAEYSEGYFIAVMRARAYKDRLTQFEQDKAAGRFKGTEEAYTKEHTTLNGAYSKAQTEADAYGPRADYYLIHFWSNIQTTDGITVYYEHIVKLDDRYKVTEATINSAIGKKDENTLILYKKDVKSGGDKMIAETKEPVEQKPANTVDTPVDSDNTASNGSVTIVTDSGTGPVETTAPASEKKKKEKKKKK